MIAQGGFFCVMPAHFESHSSTPVVHRPRTTDSAPPNDGSSRMDGAAGRWPAVDRETPARAPSFLRGRARHPARAPRPATSAARQASEPGAGHARAVRIQVAGPRRHRRPRDQDSTVPWAQWQPCGRHRMSHRRHPSTRASDLPTHRRMGCRFREPSFLEPGLQSECARLTIVGGPASLQVAGIRRRPGMREHPRAGDQGLPPAIDGDLQRA